MKRRALLFAAGAGATALAGQVLRPRVRASERFTPIQLDQQIPAAFGDWRIDPTVMPILPDPSVQARLDVIYNQVLARTYVNSKGQRVMLSIAYGADQGNDATAVHRPEFCYTSQGFIVKGGGEALLQFPDHQLRVRRLISSMGRRFEPITYWVTLNDRALLPGVSRKLEQIRLGLLGLIPDGMLMRLSTIGLQTEESFALQDAFTQQLAAAMPAEVRVRYFGRGD